MQKVIDQLVDSGAESGIQVSAYHRGRLVVDAVAGAADSATGRPYASDTLTYTTSTAKVLTSTALHVLVHQGVVDYDTAVSSLWPEFAAQGKDGVTVRQVLTHTAGVPALPADTTAEDLCDWEKMTAAIAAAKPWWEPGTKMGYHPQTYGYLAGEIVRRACGRSIDAVLAEDVAAPLGLTGELYFAVPKDQLGRVAALEEAPFDPAAAEHGEEQPDMSQFPMFRVVEGYTPAPMAAMPSAEFGNRPDVLASTIPAGGTTTARGLARLYAALLGDVEGVELIGQEQRRLISTSAVADNDEVIGFPQNRSLGFTIGLPMSPLDSPTLFGWAGACGTAAYADTASGLAVAVNKTRCHYGQFDAFGAVAQAAAEALGVTK